MCGLLVDTGDEQAGDQTHLLSRVKSTAGSVLFHATKHTGVGLVCAVAYFDPYVFQFATTLALFDVFIINRGNWGVDLQAGSQFGYKLLFVVLLAGLFAVYMQVYPSIFSLL